MARFGLTVIVLSPLLCSACAETDDAVARFDCADAGTASVRFPGPDTVVLSFAGETYELPRVRTASGARYVADNVSFWNQGDEAMIELGSSRVTCARLGADP